MTLDATQTRERIAEDARACGVRPGSVLLVHASLSSLGRVAGGAETVVAGLLDALGPGGTLAMPALSYLHVDAARPLFDVRATPANVGAIPEHFRRRAGTSRSVNPTHSVCAVGPQATELLDGHRQDRTPCGEHSPFRRLRELDGAIAFIGCGLMPNTSMHAIEELVEPPYLFGDLIAYQAVLADGTTVDAPCRRHGFVGWGQRYDRLEPLLKGALTRGRILNATVQVVRCRPMWDAALAALAEDPLTFVERLAR